MARLGCLTWLSWAQLGWICLGWSRLALAVLY